MPVEYLGIEQGLSNNAVTAIYQDHYGQMWFGTYDGLNRYDGYQFKVYRNKPDDTTSLINNRIVAICEDQQDNLWIGTKQGVSVYSNKTLSFAPLTYLPYQQAVPERLNLAINDIKTDEQGNILIASGGRGLMVCRKEQRQARQIPYREGADVLLRYHAQAIRVDQQQRIWLFVQGKGLCLYDEQAGVVKPVSKVAHTGFCLETDNKGTFWIGSENGLVSWHMPTGRVKAYDEQPGMLTSNRVVALCLDKSNRLWIATDGGGINMLDVATGSISYLLPGQQKNR